MSILLWINSITAINNSIEIEECTQDWGQTCIWYVADTQFNGKLSSWSKLPRSSLFLTVNETWHRKIDRYDVYAKKMKCSKSYCFSYTLPTITSHFFICIKQYRFWFSICVNLFSSSFLCLRVKPISHIYSNSR